MDKKTVYAIAAGAGLVSVMGMAAMRKRHSNHRGHQAYRGMMDFKNEFAGELSTMARRAGRTMLKVGRSLDRMAH